MEWESLNCCYKTSLLPTSLLQNPAAITSASLADSFRNQQQCGQSRYEGVTNSQENGGDQSQSDLDNKPPLTPVSRTTKSKKPPSYRSKALAENFEAVPGVRSLTGYTFQPPRRCGMFFCSAVLFGIFVLWSLLFGQVSLVKMCGA